MQLIHRRFFIFFNLLLLFLLSGCEQLSNYTQEQRLNNMSSYGLGPQYKIAFDSTGWKKTRVETDAGGYYMLYLPTGPASSEKILLNYGKGIKTPLIQSMNESLNVEARLPCATNRHKVFSQTNNTLSFISEISGCRGGDVSGIVIIHKVFNQPDGQYSISYSAPPEHVSEGRIVAVENKILAAKIVPSP